jgi:hypothetical protein
MAVPILAHFDALTKRGLKIIPLRENSKVPLCKAWNSDWDREVVRDKICQFPDANLGILLGDVVDVEGDSEDANRTILDLIGDYPHPCYFSTKSIHHLFLNPDPNLPHTNAPYTPIWPALVAVATWLSARVLAHPGAFYLT